MEGLTDLWALTWGDGFILICLIMGLYTYKVWIDNKFKK